MSIYHHDRDEEFSRYAQSHDADSLVEKGETPQPDTQDTPDALEGQDGDTGGKYRCQYCNDVADSCDLIKAHHTFLHSHLPLRSAPLTNDDTFDESEGASLPGVSHSVSSVRLVSGPLRATARKSLPSSGLRRKKISRGYACKSGRARQSVAEDAPSTSKRDWQDDDAIDPKCSKKQRQLESSTEGLTTTVDIGSGEPIGVPQFNTFFDMHPKVVLADVSKAMQIEEN